MYTHHMNWLTLAMVALWLYRQQYQLHTLRMYTQHMNWLTLAVTTLWLHR